MSLNHSPKVVTYGLVFYYDMSNPQKSWRGKPMTNYISNPTEEMARGEFGQYRDLAPTFNTYGLVPYSLSMDIKTNKNGSVLVYMQNGSYTKYSFVGSSVNATAEWQRFYFNNLTPAISTPSETAAILATYTGYGSGVTPTVRNIQLELGSYATASVDGSRSNTQAILDLTGNYVLTPTNLSYLSSGTFSFVGSSYIDLNSSNIITGNDPFTVEAWYTTTGTTSDEIFGNYGSSSTAGTLWISGRYGTYINGAVYFPGAPLGAGTYFLSTTRDTSGNVILYKNGVQVNSGVLAASIPVTYNFRIGADVNGAGEPFTGSIHSVKVYNRVLTAAEIAQNFNAHRSRYGI
jgi:hypothetical protein